MFSFLNRSEFRQKLIGTLSGYLSQKYSILYTEIELELSANFLIEAKILNEHILKKAPIPYILF